jgi:hypothetical protein
MTRLQQLNTSFILFLADPFNQEAWVNFDLTCIYLNKEGYIFIKGVNEFNCFYKTIRFSRKQQQDFISVEKKKALDLQFFDYLNQVLDYKRDVLSKCWKVKRKIKVYQMDYFIEKDKVIHFDLSGHPLIDLKLQMILKRRCKVITH